MIGLYRKENLITPYATIPINSGNISGERNGYHNLSFSVLNSYLKQQQIKIDHNTIFKVRKIYYAQATGGSNDTKLIASNFTAELLQIQVMMFKYIQEITLKGTTLSSALAAILEGTIFKVGDCESIGAFDFQVTNTNAQQALADLIKQTGTEVKYEGLSISLKSNQHTVPIILNKGMDFTTLDENTDTSDVITKVHFKSTKGDITGTVTSEHASKYNFDRETYQEFEGDTLEVVEKEVISAKTAHILNAWIRDLNVEYLETNFDALDVRKPAPLNNVRNCIRIEDEKIHYITQNLSPTEVQDYKNKDGYQIYYTAINEHPQAYRYFTLTDPTSIYPDLTPAQVEGFKVKVRKVVAESVKASFEFGDTGQNTPYPKMVWGAGTDVSGTTDNGKGFIFKGLDGLVLRYVTSTGKTHEIKLGENGIEGLPQGGGSVGGQVPQAALTLIVFFSDGLMARFGTLDKRWYMVEDDTGRLVGFYDLESYQRIPVHWTPNSIMS